MLRKQSYFNDDVHAAVGASRSVLGLLLFMLLLHSVYAEQAEVPILSKGEYRTEFPADPLEIITLRLDKALIYGFKGQAKPVSVVLTLYRRGEGICSGWGMVESLNGRGVDSRTVDVNDYKSIVSMPFTVYTKNLRVKDGTVSGSAVHWQMHNARPYDAESWTINAKLTADGMVAGSYQGLRPKNPLILNSPVVKLSGEVTGKVIAGAALQQHRASNALAPEASWPWWLGPYSNGQAYAYDGELVDTWADARIAWKAELNLAPGISSQGRTGGVGYDYNGPIAADGKVYFCLLEPSSNVPLWKTEQIQKVCFGPNGPIAPQAERQAKWYGAVVFDDVVYCLDASTGALLWRNVFPRRGTRDFNGKAKHAHWSAPVFHDGHLYWQGSNSRLYCMDAENGKLVWEVILVQEVADLWDTVLASIPADKEWISREDLPPGFHACQFNLQKSPCLVDGVLICTAINMTARHRAGSGLYGIDPKTGAVLWGPLGPNVGGYGSPFRWQHDGREYILTTDLRCIEPRTGKVLWSHPRRKGTMYCGAVSKGFFYPAAKAETATLYRIDATGARVHAEAKHLSREFIAKGRGGVTCDDDGYFFTWFGPNRFGKDRVQDEGLYALDHNMKVVASSTGGLAHSCGYGTMSYSNGRIIVPGTKHGMWMFNWDAEAKELKNGGRLFVNYYWCSPHIMLDGRVIFRNNDSLMCYDLRKSP